ncbi:MAG: hypothetical protein QM817_38010 [Archangium sp.]
MPRTPFLLLALAACGPTPTTETKNTFLVTVSGEGAAANGITFPPGATGGAPYFVDGWEVKFEHVLVTVGSVSINDNPDLNPNDQSATGALVAEAAGPWAIDLAKPGALEGKEGNGTAHELVRITAQNKKSGAPAFDATSKYALGFSLVAADSKATRLAFDADAETLYQSMQSKDWTVLLSGTATWKGTAGNPACRSTSTSYDFTRYPKSTHFVFGFKAPVQFKNCVNPELSPADSRGVQTQTNAQTVVQLTFHLDHPFWEALEEDAPLRWDALAATKSVSTGMGPATSELTNADLAFDFQAPRDAQGIAIPWRTCGPTLANERSSGTVAYDPVNVPVSPSGGANGLRDLSDYMTYNLSTFGHLNADGLCFPARQYPSPR